MYCVTRQERYEKYNRSNGDVDAVLGNENVRCQSQLSEYRHCPSINRLYT